MVFFLPFCLYFSLEVRIFRFFALFLAIILNSVYLCAVTTLVYSPYFCYEIKSFASQSVVRLSTFACFLRCQAGAGLSV